MRVDFSEFRAAYLAEVDEHISAAHQRLEAIATARREDRPQGRELRELMRLLHTIKGLSSMVGVDAVVDISHEMEGVVRGADQSGARLADDAIDALVTALRAIEQRVGALAKNEAVEPASANLLKSLASIVSRRSAIAPVVVELEGDPEIVGRLTPSEREQLVSAGAAGRRALRIDFAPSPRKADAGISISTVRERLAKLGELVKVMPIAAPASERAPSGLLFVLFVITDAGDNELANAVGGTGDDITALVAVKESALIAEAAPPSIEIEHDESLDTRRAGFLRVDVARVDDTIEKLGTLIVTRSRLANAVARLRTAGADTRELDGVLVDLSRQLRDLRGAILSVRMVPLATVLDRLPLVVRGLQRTTGKKVRLSVEAGTAELDKTVAEKLFPAFVQLVRNAVDHGIEAPSDRTAAGKREEGLIRITAVALGNRFVEVRVMDDGAGIDAAAIAKREHLAEGPRAPAAILDILCRPGFSTRDSADQSSGRGVGMDIVKRTIESLGGMLTLETERGRGTTFIARVPLTIAVVDAFTVSCGGRRFAVPVPGVAEIVEVDPASMAKSPTRLVRDGARATGDVRVFARRGETLALVDLATMLGIDTTGKASTARQAFVVRRSTGEAVAFAIDRVTGQQETVVRPIDDPLVASTGVAGSTDLGDGEPTLVLDLVALSSSLGAIS